MEKHHRPREEDHKTREKLQSYAGDSLYRMIL